MREERECVRRLLEIIRVLSLTRLEARNEERNSAWRTRCGRLARHRVDIAEKRWNDGARWIKAAEDLAAGRAESHKVGIEVSLRPDADRVGIGRLLVHVEPADEPIETPIGVLQAHFLRERLVADGRPVAVGAVDTGEVDVLVAQGVPVTIGRDGCQVRITEDAVAVLSRDTPFLDIVGDIAVWRNGHFQVFRIGGRNADQAETCGTCINGCAKRTRIEVHGNAAIFAGLAVIGDHAKTGIAFFEQHLTAHQETVQIVELAVAVHVFDVAIALTAQKVDAHGNVFRNRTRDHRFAAIHIIVAEASFEVSLRLELRFGRIDGHNARGGVAAEKRALWAAQDFNAGKFRHFRKGDTGLGANHAIDQDANSWLKTWIVRTGTNAADRDARTRSGRLRLRDLHRWCDLLNVVEAGNTRIFQQSCVKGCHRNRHILNRGAGTACGFDHNSIQTALAIFCLVGFLSGCRQDRGTHQCGEADTCAERELHRLRLAGRSGKEPHLTSPKICFIIFMSLRRTLRPFSSAMQQCNPASCSPNIPTGCSAQIGTKNTAQMMRGVSPSPRQRRGPTLSSVV